MEVKSYPRNQTTADMTRPPSAVGEGGPSSYYQTWGLLSAELRVDVAEQRVQAALELRETSDDADADEGGDQAVLNGGRAGFVLSKTSAMKVVMNASPSSLSCNLHNCGLRGS